MATKQSMISVTLEAGGDLSAAQFTFVLLASDAQVDQVSSAGGDADGVLQNDPSAAGRAATVAIGGIVKVKAGAVVAAGAKVQSDATGRAITAATGDHVLGKAVTAAGAADEIISVLLKSTHILA